MISTLISTIEFVVVIVVAAPAAGLLATKLTESGYTGKLITGLELYQKGIYKLFDQAVSSSV